MYLEFHRAANGRSHGKMTEQILLWFTLLHSKSFAVVQAVFGESNLPTIWNKAQELLTSAYL